MSKIGNRIIVVKDKVDVKIVDNIVTVKGPKGELNVAIATNKIVLEQGDKQIVVKRLSNDKETKAMHGLYNALITNMIQGVTQPYELKLSLVGVGYRVQKKGDGLSMTLGFSHPIEVKAVKGITFTLEGDTNILVQGADKQLVGQVAADIRSIRRPEPYKGKGVRLSTEKVRRKAGKSGKK